MSKKLVLITLICAALLSLPFSSTNNINLARADDPADFYPYEVEFENGTVFKMYPDYYLTEYGCGYSCYGTVCGDSNCRQERTYTDDYLNSGLYYNAEPFENIYLINSDGRVNGGYNYFYESDLVFSKDGIYFANLPWTVFEWTPDTEWSLNPALNERGGHAIEFYNSGVLTKQYYLHDLAKDYSKLSFSVSHVVWENYALRNFDSENNTLSITTLDGITTVFDLTTGNILGGNEEPLNCIPTSNCGTISFGGGHGWGMFALILSFGAAALYALRKRKVI